MCKKYGRLQKVKVAQLQLPVITFKHRCKTTVITKALRFVITGNTLRVTGLHAYGTVPLQGNEYSRVTRKVSCMLPLRASRVSLACTVTNLYIAEQFNSTAVSVYRLPVS